MNRRALYWLAGGLAVLVLLAVLGQRRTATTPLANADTEFLPGLMDSLDDVDSVAIAGAGNVPVATLDRGTDGWRVRERDGYAADLTKVRHTLLSLAEAKIIETKTSNAELYSMLGVEDVDAADATGFVVTLNGLTPPVSVIVGRAAGDYRRYVRRVGQAQSYLINRDPEIGETAPDWLDKAIVDLPSARVRSVTVTHPDGEILRVAKSSPDQQNFTVENIPEGRSLLYDSVANVMASVLQGLTLEDVERAVDSDAPQTVTQFVTFDGLVITARGIDQDDGASWVSFAAAAAPGAPADAAPTTEAAAAAEPAAGTPAETEGADDDANGADPATEAAELNARLGGWRYRIPSYKFEQMTRGMDDLLKAKT